MEDPIDNKSLLGNITANSIGKKAVIIQAGTDFNSLDPDEPENRFDPASILLSCKVDPTKKIDKPPTVIEIKSGNKVVPSFTLGNFSMIIGKAKSKKTFFLTCLASAAISGSSILDNIKGCLPFEKKNVLYFDTEQSEYHLYKTINRICRLSGNQSPDNFKAYGLRKFTPNERLKLIEYAIYNNPKIGLVFIDGLRDLITKGINDEGEATIISSNLLKWTAERDIHIIQVLHENKGDNNARGHVGTECLNKAETTIRLEISPNDREISIVDCVYSRDISFEPFAFRIDEKGLPVVCDMPVKTVISKPSKEPDKISDDQHFSVLDKVYKANPEPQYHELWKAIKTGFNEQGVIFGENKAKEYVPYYSKQNWIKKDENKKVYKDIRMV